MTQEQVPDEGPRPVGRWSIDQRRSIIIALGITLLVAPPIIVVVWLLLLELRKMS